jgi:CDP-glucose 4,6-dehydratase
MSDSALFWSDRSVLVTGCTGFLGGWLCSWLVAHGANVVGLVRDAVPRARLFRERIAGGMNLVHGDVTDADLIEQTLGEYEVLTVFHLAAQPIVGVANRNPVSTFETNVRGTWQLLEACRRSPMVAQVVIASSDKAYGAQPRLPYREDTPLAGTHPYDVSKSCADLIAHSYAETFGLPVAITRCGNFYGGGDLNFNRLVPGTVRSRLQNCAPVVRSDGLYTRDYLYVEDAVLAYVALAEEMAARSDLAGEAFNFSAEQPLTVLQLAGEIARVVGRTDPVPHILGEASNEIRDQYLSAEKARQMLRWEPRYPLAVGLRRTVQWYADFLNIPWSPRD